MTSIFSPSRADLYPEPTGPPGQSPLFPPYSRPQVQGPWPCRPGKAMACPVMAKDALKILHDQRETGIIVPFLLGQHQPRGPWPAAPAQGILLNLSCTLRFILTKQTLFPQWMLGIAEGRKTFTKFPSSSIKKISSIISFIIINAPRAIPEYFGNCQRESSIRRSSASQCARQVSIAGKILSRAMRACSRASSVPAVRARASSSFSRHSGVPDIAVRIVKYSFFALSSPPADFTAMRTEAALFLFPLLAEEPGFEPCRP